MKIKEIETCYISCACNRTPHSADWGSNGLICYGACNSVAIYDPKDCYGGRVLYTLSGHKARVNSVKWIHGKALLNETELVSASTDGTAIIWTNNAGNYELGHILKGHESSVTVVDGIYQSNNCLIVATASVDSTIKVWKRSEEKDVVCKSTITLGSGLCLSLSFTSLSTSDFLLACGTDDCKIHLYSEQNDDIAKLESLSGHEDWVQALDFTKSDNGDILLASGSQDSTVRLWRFHPPDSNKSDAFTVEEQIIKIGQTQLAVRLEAVLAGHDGWVYGVHWHPPLVTETGCIQPEKLLSGSLDKSVIIWSPEEESGVWLEGVRVGEVGGNTLGFYGARFGPKGEAIIAHSFQGGFHIWQRCKDIWKPGVTVGGHFDAVTDLAWEPDCGHCIVSVSSDQTTRLHAPWLQQYTKQQKSWHEIARPQIHGYDLICLAMLPNYQFASGADEKVVRAFSAPQNFLDNFKRLCLDADDKELIKNSLLPCGASVPTLGLSNRAVFSNEADTVKEEKKSKDQYEDDVYFTPQLLTEPPTEDTLMQNTFWPEVMKLYGHGYEIYSLAATSDGTLLASACKATSAEHAAILLWETKTWQKVGKLMSHQLTVTQLSFSPNNQYLLSVSRDRRWSLFEKQPEDSQELYKLVATTNKSTGVHTRIIWCCAWTHDSRYFATGSREGKVVVWGKTNKAQPAPGELYGKFTSLDIQGESVTSLAFSPVFFYDNSEYLLSMGMESGMIKLYTWKPSSEVEWTQHYQLDKNYGHQLTVKRLAFRPVQGEAGKTKPDSEDSVLQLASAAMDNTVKVYNVYICKT